MATVYAENVNYWQSSTTAADTWMDRAKKEISSIGGKITGEAYGSDANGRAAFVLGFALGEDVFKVTWPVLPSKGGNQKAAKIQAATMLYHDVKAKCVAAKVIGVRKAFFADLMLPDGRVASNVATPDLVQMLPALLTGGGS